MQKFHFVTKSWKICKKTIDNFPYPKYNDLVMQLGISKNFKKKKESALTMRKQTKIMCRF